jgi:hypothetical protein
VVRQDSVPAPTPLATAPPDKTDSMGEWAKIQTNNSKEQI